MSSLRTIIRRRLSRAFRRDPLSRSFPSWEAAAAASIGYATDLTIYGAQAERVRAGLEEPPNETMALLAALALVGRARILDFGGGVGLAYLCMARMVPDLIETWQIVDLPRVVRWGRKHLADGHLTYSETVPDDLAPNLLLCAGVLQCLPAPYATLTELLALKPAVVVLDRLPLHPREQIYVQTWPKALGGGSAPYRTMLDEKITDIMGGYRLLIERDLRAPDPGGKIERYVCRGYRRAV